MKKLPFFVGLLVISASFLQFIPKETSLKGAWQQPNAVLLFTNSYFSVSEFDAQKKVFTQTFGGTYTKKSDEIEFAIEFCFPDTQRVGQRFSTRYTLNGNDLTLKMGVQGEKWASEGSSETTPLSSLWQITGREQKEGTMGEIKKGARKTVKIMTNNRFQWIALNTETKAFSGTGGGTYTLKDGKYTETIAFFSRDSTRVGMSLSFDAKVDGKTWQHTGKSSKGDRVNEIWERQD